MSKSIAPRSIRIGLAAAACLALLVGTAAPSAAATGTDPLGDDARGRRHPYSLVGGTVHVRPQVVPSSHAESPASAPLRSDDPRTQLVWSQFAPDFSGSRILLMRGDGTGQRSLTPATPGAYDVDPRVSPDGRSVLFERDRDDGVDVVVIGIDGTGERVIPLGCVDPCAADVVPMWGPDGRSVWFTRVIGPFDDAGNAASAVLWAADLDGGDVHRVTAPGIDPAWEDYAAKFLPNGDRVSIRVRNADIRSMLVRTDRDGREFPLTDLRIDADMFDISSAVTGPTSSLIVFETFGHGAPEGTAQAVATVPGDCRSAAACLARVRYLTPTTMDLVHPSENYNPVWSPDGLRIAFAHAYYATDADPTFGADIWTMGWDGSRAAAFNDAPEWDYRPDWAAIPLG